MDEQVIYLGRHDLSICSSDLDAGVQAGPVVSLHDIPAIGFVSSHTTVVWTCRGINMESQETGYQEIPFHRS